MADGGVVDGAGGRQAPAPRVPAEAPDERSASAALDRLVAAHRALEEARRAEKDAAEGTPDPGRTFSGVAEVLEFNRMAGEHARTLADKRAARAAAEGVFREASRRCDFVPEMAAIDHVYGGKRWLVRRDPPKARYGEGAEGTSAEGTSAEGTSAQGVPAEEAPPADESGGEIVFVVVDRGAADGRREEERALGSTLLAGRRTPVVERLTGERPGRGAGSRRGRREPPGGGSVGRGDRGR